MKPSVTEELKEEMLKVLSQTSSNQESTALTTQEISSLVGFGEDKVRNILNEMKKQGSLEVVFIYKEDLDGGISKRPAYKLKTSKISTS